MPPLKRSRKSLTLIPDGLLVGSVTGELHEIVNPRTRWWRVDRWAIFAAIHADVLVGRLTNGKLSLGSCHGRLRFYNVDGDEVEHFVRRSKLRLPRVPCPDVDEEK